MGKNQVLIELVVVLVLVIFGLYLLTNKSSPSVVNNPVVTPTEDTSAGSINVGVSAASLSYANALVTYKSARLQLDEKCQAVPNKMTFKNNAYLMIDNRAPVARTVKVGSVFSVKAWSFKIVKLSSVKLPATWLVDCGTSQNVATVLIQK
jgi:hypothetical protein